LQTVAEEPPFEYSTLCPIMCSTCSCCLC